MNINEIGAASSKAIEYGVEAAQEGIESLKFFDGGKKIALAGYFIGQLVSGCLHVPLTLRPEASPKPTPRDPLPGVERIVDPQDVEWLKKSAEDGIRRLDQQNPDPDSWLLGDGFQLQTHATRIRDNRDGTLKWYLLFSTDLEVQASWVKTLESSENIPSLTRYVIDRTSHYFQVTRRDVGLVPNQDTYMFHDLSFLSFPNSTADVDVLLTTEASTTDIDVLTKSGVLQEVIPPVKKNDDRVISGYEIKDQGGLNDYLVDAKFNDALNGKTFKLHLVMKDGFSPQSKPEFALTPTWAQKDEGGF